MRRPASFVALAAVLAAAAGCWSGSSGPASAAGPAPQTVAESAAGGRYTLALSVADVTGTVVAASNGFPVWRQGVAGRMTDDDLDLDLTPALVSGRNTASVRVVPVLGRSGDRLGAAPVRFGIEVYRAGGEWVEGTSVSAAETEAQFEAYLAGLRSRWSAWSSSGGAALDSARAWARAHPFEVSVAFERPGGGRPADGAPSFDGVFRGAPVIAGTAADSARLRAYAARLYALTADRDTAALWEAFEGRYADEFVWWGGEAAVGADSAASMAGARGRLVFGRAVPFEAADVRLRSWSGGRVWEVYRDGARGLLEPEDRSTWQAVYVGEGPDGALRVVR